MKQKIRVLFSIIILMLLTQRSRGADAITISHVVGYDSTAGGVMANTPIKFYFEYEAGALNIVAVQNCFSMSTPNGATWEILTLTPLPALLTCFNVSSLWGGHVPDGQGVDTIFCSAFDSRGVPIGLAPGSENDLYYVETEFSDVHIGKTICIDSVSILLFINNEWLWADLNGTGPVFPSWGGPYCYEIVDCCVGNRGDVNGDGVGPNVVDLNWVVNTIFRGYPTPDCRLEADVNGDGTSADILDLNYIINHRYRGGPPPPACP